MPARLALLIASLTGLLAAPVAATEMGSAARARHEQSVRIPGQVSNSQAAAYRALFQDLDASQWERVIGRLDAMRAGPLDDYVRARLYTAPGSPRVDVSRLEALLRRAPYLPQAGDLARLARSRGAEDLPSIPVAQRLIGQRGQPRRQRPRTIRTEALAGTLDALIQPLIRDDQPDAAEALIAERGSELSTPARAEFQQRVGWSYYISGRDADARRLSTPAADVENDWGIQAQWTVGLASWRLEDCRAATTAFADVARRSRDTEMVAAAHYWTSRAATACRRTSDARAALRAAAALDETFYGLLAQTALGQRETPGGPTALTADEWRRLADRPNIRIVIALMEVGEYDAAASLIRHQARIGPAGEHVALLHLAARLDLPETQMFLAHNAPAGVRIAAQDRYPAPDWRPASGWRVDQALAYAHALQESNFRPDAASAAGARGLMQVRPGTAGDLIRWGRAQGNPQALTDPANNLLFGQAYLRYLADQSGTNGLLPRVIAAYNAGPAPIAAWNTRVRDGGDPLLWIESIPYWETRGYVPIVLRNYWMYENAPAASSASRRALVNGLWPRFPGLGGSQAVRVRQTQTAASSRSERAR